jgi:hypothetical protein
MNRRSSDERARLERFIYLMGSAAVVSSVLTPGPASLVSNDVIVISTVKPHCGASAQ